MEYTVFGHVMLMLACIYFSATMYSFRSSWLKSSTQYFPFYSLLVSANFWVMFGSLADKLPLL